MKKLLRDRLFWLWLLLCCNVVVFNTLLVYSGDVWWCLLSGVNCFVAAWFFIEEIRR